MSLALYLSCVRSNAVLGIRARAVRRHFDKPYVKLEYRVGRDAWHLLITVA
jgi:hypothetical protein